MWLSVTETERLAYGQSLTLPLANILGERLETGREGSPVQVLCLREGLLFCSSLSERQTEELRVTVSLFIHSSTWEQVLAYWLRCCGETALRARSWLGDRPAQGAQGAQGSRRPWVVVRIQHFSHSYFSYTVCISQMQWQSSSSVVVEEWMGCVKK